MTWLSSRALAITAWRSNDRSGWCNALVLMSFNEEEEEAEEDVVEDVVETPSARAKKLFCSTPSASWATKRVGNAGPDARSELISLSLSV